MNHIVQDTIQALDTVYVLHRHLDRNVSAKALAMTFMESYDFSVCHGVVEEHGLEAVAREEWEQGWIPSSSGSSFLTQADAEVANEDQFEGRGTVTEVGFEDLKAALEELLDC